MRLTLRFSAGITVATIAGCSSSTPICTTARDILTALTMFLTQWAVPAMPSPRAASRSWATMRVWSWAFSTAMAAWEATVSSTSMSASSKARPPVSLSTSSTPISRP